MVEGEAVVQKAMEAPALDAAGAEAVADAEERQGFRTASRAPLEEAKAVRHIGDHAFVYRAGVWADTSFTGDELKVTEIPFGSHRYFELAADPAVAPYLALGPQVIFVLDGEAYQIVPSTHLDFSQLTILSSELKK